MGSVWAFVNGICLGSNACNSSIKVSAARLLYRAQQQLTIASVLELSQGCVEQGMPGYVTLKSIPIIIPSSLSPNRVSSGEGIKVPGYQTCLF